MGRARTKRNQAAGDTCSIRLNCLASDCQAVPTPLEEANKWARHFNSRTELKLKLQLELELKDDANAASRGLSI